MPLIANTDLPSFRRLSNEGYAVVSADAVPQRDLLELHIGLLNMMPDKALEATERQFLRLIGDSNQLVRFHVHLFTLNELQRGATAQAHVDRYYRRFEDIRAGRLDAMIITGANVTKGGLEQQVFWQPLADVVDWACHNVVSVLCSCLATHAVLQFRYHHQRIRLPAKRWGVYSHQVIDKSHPLMAGTNTRFDVPHSRFNQVQREQFIQAGLQILVESEVAGVHLAASSDGFRLIFFQGHPEYDANSLLKEYKREVGRYLFGETDVYPPFPDNYFTLQSRAILDEYRQRAILIKQAGDQPPAFPEALISDTVDNTWCDSAKAIVSNWVGKVCRTALLVDIAT